MNIEKEITELVTQYKNLTPSEFENSIKGLDREMVNAVASGNNSIAIRLAGFIQQVKKERPTK